MTLIIFAGIPSAGKTTIAKELISLAKKEGIELVRVDSDDLRTQLYEGEFEPEQEEIIRKETLSQIESLLQQGFHVISDDLNYYRSMRHDLISLASHHGVNYFIINVSAPLKQALDWNQKRGLPVPQDVIKKIHEKFDRFGKYRWDTPIIEIPMNETSASEAATLIFQTLRRRFSEKIPVKEPIPPHTPSTQECLDLALRARISSFLSSHPNKGLAKKVNDLRKKLLKKVKKERISLEMGLKDFDLLLKDLEFKDGSEAIP